MSRGGFSGEEWDWCQRCGRQRPVSLLQKQQGSLRCTISCVDDLSNQYRAKQLAEVMRNSKEGMSDKPEIFKDPGEVVFE